MRARSLVESVLQESPLHPEWDNCPRCGKRYVLQCRCSSHTLESVQAGHGKRCPEGHRWSYDRDGRLLFVEGDGKPVESDAVRVARGDV